jgi:uncharacterized protein
MNDSFEERTYRAMVTRDDLVPFRVVERESDLFIMASRDLSGEAREALRDARKMLERYIEGNPAFLASLSPLPPDLRAPPMIQEMISAGITAGVGPMAAVAGAVAEFVARRLLDRCDEAIVENGGDIFLASRRDRYVRIFTTNPSFGDRVRLRISKESFPLSVCTSSGIIGPSLSFGLADAATVISSSGSIADAAATALGNMVKSEAHIAESLETVKNFEGVKGILVIIKDRAGIWGDVELVTP